MRLTETEISALRKLLRAFPELAFFFYYHFTINKKPTLRPVFRGSDISFPTSYEIERKELSFDQKIIFYAFDLKHWRNRNVRD